MIPKIDLALLTAGDASAVQVMHIAVTDIGFATIHNTVLDHTRATEVIKKLPRICKRSEH